MKSNNIFEKNKLPDDNVFWLSSEEEDELLLLDDVLPFCVWLLASFSLVFIWLFRRSSKIPLFKLIALLPIADRIISF